METAAASTTNTTSTNSSPSLQPPTSQVMWSMESRMLRALQFDECQVVESLLREGLDPDVRLGPKKVPVICHAVSKSCRPIIRLLLAAGCSVAQTDLDGTMALHYACNFFSYKGEIVQLLLEACPAVVDMSNGSGLTGLHIAATASNVELARILVEAGATVDKPDLMGVTPLMLAVGMKSLDLVDYLVSVGGNVNAHDYHSCTPLIYAIESDLRPDPEMLRHVIDAGADLNDEANMDARPLLAVIKRSSEHEDSGRLSVQALIEAGVDVNVRDNDSQYMNETPLNVALARGQFSLVEMLVRAGADTVEPNMDRVSPLRSLINSSEHRLARLVAGMLPRLCQDDLETIDREKLFTDDAFLAKFIYGSVEASIIQRPLPLRHLCRVALRKHHGRHADRCIDRLPLCPEVRSYLKLEFL